RPALGPQQQTLRGARLTRATLQSLPRVAEPLPVRLAAAPGGLALRRMPADARRGAAQTEQHRLADRRRGARHLRLHLAANPCGAGAAGVTGQSPVAALRGLSG